jgi:L-glutamine:scyllo-inosose aminotransferase
MTAGEGGMILTSDKQLEERCQSHVNCGRKEPGYNSFEGLVFSGNFRITEFQAALLNVRLKYMEPERKVREDNATYLTGLLNQIDGIRPMVRDERITHQGVYQYIFRYDPQAFKGVHRDKFVEALGAEGVPADGDFYIPIYDSPLFPITAAQYPAIRDRYGDKIDKDKISCPVCEKAAYHEAVWLHHPLFMGDKKGMEIIAEAIAKIQKNAEELL